MKTRLLKLALALGIAAPAGAQSGPAGQPGTINPLYVPIFGVTAGIALPVGRLASDHAAGFSLGGLVEYAVAGQPYALRGELIWQRYALKSGRTTGSDVNLTSLGATIVSKSLQPTTGANTFVLGGIAVYNGTDLGTRPGVNGGAGIEIPLQGFSATGEARLHVMFSEGKPILTIPLTIGIRF